MSSKAKYVFFDIETTGFSPATSNLITMAAYVCDENYNILDVFDEACNVGKQRWTKNIRGFAVDNWNPEGSEYPPQKTHGITWEQQLEFQEPIDFYRKLWKFFQQWPDDKLQLVFHANTAFDIRHLFYHANIHAPTMYQYLSRRFTDYTPCEEDHSHTIRHDNTMTMARAYIKNSKDIFKEATKLQKQIDKYQGYLTKKRKTPARPEKLAEWRAKKDEAVVALGSLDASEVQFEGHSLDKLCKGLGIHLNHHEAKSDAKALIEIHKFFSR